MGSTEPKCTRKEQEARSKNLDDKTLPNPDGLLISREEQRIPNTSSSSAQRRFTAEEKRKSVVLASRAADPARGERFQQAHFSGPGCHSVKAAWTPSGGLADTSSWQSPQASVFSLLGNNGNHFAAASPGPLRALSMEEFAGRCFRCLSYGHKVAECINPLRCIRCLNFGHRAMDCRSFYHKSPVLDYSELPALYSKDDMGFILPAGTAPQRPEIVRACATFSAAMVTSERDLARRAVIAAVTGGSPAVSRRQVAQAFAVRFQIAQDDVEVSLYSQDSDYLVSFKNPAVHGTDAFGSGFPSCLWMGNSNSVLKITPWTRQSQATAVVKLHYKVRLCIEGVPPHARQVETIRGLLHPSTLIEGIDRNNLSDKESACLCIWVWTNDPYCFAKEGVLQVEELPGRADDTEPWEYPELGFVDQRRRQPCFQPVCLLSYKVLLHIDKVIDFSPTTEASFQPWMLVFRWQLGVTDGDLPPIFSPPTCSTLY